MTPANQGRKQRTDATGLLNFERALQELLSFNFAFAALAAWYKPGSYENENAANVLKGMRYRIDYLHDCFTTIMEIKDAQIQELELRLKEKSIEKAM